MGVPSVTDFLFALRQSQVLDASYEDLLTRQFQGRYRDAPSLGRELVRLGWLRGSLQKLQSLVGGTPRRAFPTETLRF